MMRFGLVFLLLLGSSLSAQNLFEYKGKTYKYSDLPKTQQQRLYDLMAKEFKSKQIFIDDYILDIYLDDLAKKQKKTKEKVRETVFKVKDASDKEVKAFYEENKASIPYPFEKVKMYLKNQMKQKKQYEIRDQVVGKIKKDNKFKLLFAAPQAPVFEMDLKPYPSKGNKKAALTIVEFADYQCPHCGHFYKAVKKVLPKFKNKINFIFVDFPINRSGISKLVAQGAYCAGKKSVDTYWKYHGMAFDNQKNLSKESPKEFAKKLKLNEKEFGKCLNDPATLKFIENSKKLGDDVGVDGTPSVYFNGKKVKFSHTEGGFEAAIKKNL